MKTSMFSVEARDLSKCAFPDAVSTITICHFLISKINARFFSDYQAFISLQISVSQTEQKKLSKSRSQNVVICSYGYCYKALLPCYRCGYCLRSQHFQRHFASWSQLLAFQSCHFLTLLYELCSDYQIEAPTSAESVILSVSKATVSPPPTGEGKR